MESGRGRAEAWLVDQMREGGMKVELHKEWSAERQTAVVDDDFPEMLHNVDSVLAALERNPPPRIVCLCGSTRFGQEYADANERETLAGKIVLSVGCFRRVAPDGEREPMEETIKVALDELHKRKIDLCDEVLVLNVGGYIGSSTRSEIDYAVAHGKPVRYLEALAGEGKEFKG